MFNALEIAQKFGGTTDKLVKGPKAYDPRTVEEMAGTIITRIDETIEVLTTYEGGKLSAPMAGLVRNGFAIKIGCGSKNESIPGFEVQRFWIENQADAIGYLVAMKEAFIAGEVNENLEEMLEGYRVRAEKGEEARRAKKELAQAA